MAVSSIGRVAYNAPSLSAYKESGGVEYGADLAGLMLPRKLNGKTDAGDLVIDGVKRKWIGVDLAIVKNRNGERSKIEFQFFPAISRFVEQQASTLTDDPWEAAEKDA